MQLRIRVGAALDANVAGLFRPLAESARRARQQIEAELGKAAKAAGSVYRDAPAHAKRSADEQIRQAKRAAEATVVINKKALDQQARDEERAAQQRARARDHVLRIRERYEREEARAAQRQARDQESFGRRTSYRAVHHFNNLGRGATAVARDVAKGAGVDLDIGGHIAKGIDLEKRSVALSNAGFMDPSMLAPGEKPTANNVRQDPKTLEAETRAIAAFAKMDPSDVMGGLEKFTGIVGDLQLGRDLMRDMAFAARATDTTFSDLAGTAGEMAQQMEGVENKAEAIKGVIRALAGQTKIGAVEFKDLASQGAKLAAAAGAFEGDIKANMGQMGAIIQMSRKMGGSVSPTAAATSISSMVSTLKTPARLGEFKAHGVEVIDPETGLMHSIQRIIIDSLKSSEGNPEEFKKMWANVQGARAVEGFATIFRNERASVLKGGGSKQAANEAGVAAVNAQFARFAKVAMGEGQLLENFKGATSTTAAKAQDFNNQVGERIMTTFRSFLPQLEKLAPAALDAVDGLAKLGTWAAENPLRAIFAAAGVAVMRAAGEATMRAGIESAIRAAFVKSGGPAGALSGSGVVGSPGGKAGAALGAAGAAVAVTAAAVTIYEVGRLVIDNVLSTEAKDKAEGNIISLTNERLALTAKMDKAGGFDAALLREMMDKRDALAERVKGAASYDTSTTAQAGAYFSGIANYVTGGAVGTSFDASTARAHEASRLGEMREELKQRDAQIAKMLGGVLKVEVVNPPAAGPPQPNVPVMGMDGEIRGGPGRRF